MTEKPGGLQSMGFEESDTTEVTLHSTEHSFNYLRAILLHICQSPKARLVVLCYQQSTNYS